MCQDHPHNSFCLFTKGPESFYFLTTPRFLSLLVRCDKISSRLFIQFCLCCGYSSAVVIRVKQYKSLLNPVPCSRPIDQPYAENHFRRILHFWFDNKLNSHLRRGALGIGWLWNNENPSEWQPRIRNRVVVIYQLSEEEPQEEEQA